jgi:hypothetical protein
VYLAGWDVDNNSLKRIDQGKIGDNGTFGIFPIGYGNGDIAGGFEGKQYLAKDDAWVLTAGKHFGITKNGMIYANSGKIGNMEVGDITTKISNAEQSAKNAE